MQGPPLSSGLSEQKQYHTPHTDASGMEPRKLLRKPNEAVGDPGVHSHLPHPAETEGSGSLGLCGFWYQEGAGPVGSASD